MDQTVKEFWEKDNLRNIKPTTGEFPEGFDPREVLKECCVNTVRSLDTNFIAGGEVVVCKECNHEIPMLTANEILEDKNKDRVDQ